MSNTPSANFSPVFQVPSSSGDAQDISTYLIVSALDTHTHAANKGLAVARVTLPVSLPTGAGALGYTTGPLLTVGDGTVARSVGSVGWLRIVGNGAITSFDFTGIPAQFETIELIVEGRLIDAVPNLAFSIRFNNDSGANYYYSGTTRTAAGVSADTSGLGVTAGTTPTLAAGTATAGATGCFRLIIPGYAQTGFNRHYHASGGHRESSISSGQIIEQTQGDWANTVDAINRVTLIGIGAIPATARATLYLYA